MINFSRLLLTLLLSASVLFLSACSKAPPEVLANGETLQGEWVEELPQVAVFRGIPFAAPPVGDLRWRAPAPHIARAGASSAIEFSPACPQGDYMIDWYAKVAAVYGHGREVVQPPNGESEDCLYLNVWTPELAPEQAMPVMVFVHGGSNKGGWSYEPNYLGEQLAARGVVVVTIAYRLGPLGFFSHSALDDGSGEAVANFGLLDIAAAFEWVRANITAFGGDAGNVTGFGESSGAGDLLDLALATDQGPALFERIIAQSAGGSLIDRSTLAMEQKRGSRLAATLGYTEDVTAAQLRDIPATDLLIAGDATLDGYYYQAVIDGKTMQRQPVDGLNGPQAAQLNILTGTNRDEWLMYVDPASTQKDVDEWILDMAPAFFGSLKDGVSDAPDPVSALDRLITAERMLCPSRFVAEKASQAGGQGLVYWFTRQRPGAGGEALGVYHGAELPYVFNRHDEWLTTEEADRKITETIMSYWVSFARDGSVRTTDLPEWPMYTASRPWVMELGDLVAAVQPPDAWLCRYFDRKNK